MMTQSRPRRARPGNLLELLEKWSLPEEEAGSGRPWLLVTLCGQHEPAVPEAGAR